jgi:hypothetical protein
MTNRVKTTTKRRAMQHPRASGNCEHEQDQLRREDAANVSLAQKQKPRRKARIVFDTSRDAFRDSSKQRERRERDDQRRQVETRNE